ncbi:MAG: hypothetical protein P8Y05_12090 [Deinococcales bacterium]
MPELHGIEARTVRFPGGLATLVRPNEWGKSTLVSALTDVLFGPEPGADTSGRARLTFVGVDGVRYRLERDLATGEGELRQEAAEPADEPEGAEGATRAASWEPVDDVDGEGLAEVLGRLLGLAEREAFVQSFCVSQPLPRPDRLGAEVQRLLVGSGRGGVERALARLEDEVALRTRNAHAWGLPDGAEDGELERLDARVEALQHSLVEGREAADGAQETARALAEAEGRRTQHQEETARLEGEAERLRAYLARRRVLEERVEAHRIAAQTLARAEALEAEAARAHAHVGEVWPELAEAPEDGEARLAALMAAERKLVEARADSQAGERTLEAARRAAAERARELERHSARAPFQDDDEGLTVDAVRELRAAAEQAATDWRAFLGREEGVAEARAALRPYAMLALAPEQDRALLRRYDYEAEARVRAVEGLEAAVREARAERRRLLVPDAALPNELEAEALRATLAAPPARWRAVMAQGSAGAMLGAAVTWVAHQALGLGASAGLGVLVGLGVIALLRPPSVAGPQLKRFRGRSRVELEELLARFDAWHVQPVPTRRDVLRLENEMEAAREQLRAFQRRMQPYQEAYPEPGTAFDAFRDAQRTLLQREEVHRELSIRTFGVAPAEVRGRSPLEMPSPWPRLAAFAEARGGRAQSVAELCSFLAEAADATWDDVIAAAQGRDEARRAFRAERERLRREVAVAETVLEEREASATALRVELQAAAAAREEQAAPLEAFLEASGGDADELLRRWRERDQAVQEAERSFDALASLLDAAEGESLAALRERVERRAAEVEEERQAVEALVGERGELPPADAQLDRPRMLDRLEALEERLAFERAARHAAEAEVFERTRELASLQAKPVVNLAKAEAERVSLLRRRKELLEEIEALATAHVELQAAVRDFQGSYRERLERLASQHLVALTEREGRRVRLLDDFGVRVVEQGGRELAPEQLSRGAQDQLTLALRLAIADGVADDVRLPLVLDDPFAHWDTSRLERLRADLQRVARERQVVLLSHDPAFASWGEEVGVG